MPRLDLVLAGVLVSLPPMSARERHREPPDALQRQCHGGLQGVGEVLVAAGPLWDELHWEAPNALTIPDPLDPFRHQMKRGTCADALHRCLSTVIIRYKCRASVPATTTGLKDINNN